MSNDNFGCLCATVIIVVFLLCVTKCTMQEEQLNWDREKAKAAAKP